MTGCSSISVQAALFVAGATVRVSGRLVGVNPKTSMNFFHRRHSRGGNVGFDTEIPTPIGKSQAHLTRSVEGDPFTGKAKLALGSAHVGGGRVA